MEPGKKCQNHREKTFRTHQVSLCLRRCYVSHYKLYQQVRVKLDLVASSCNVVIELNVGFSGFQLSVERNQAVTLDLLLLRFEISRVSLIGK